MRIASSNFFNSVVDTENGFLNTLVIENSHLFYRFACDICNQISGNNGSTVVSENDKPCIFPKRVELLDQFVPFEVNTRLIISKLNAAFEQNALSPDYYETGMQLLSEIECFLNSMSLDLPCDVLFTKLNMGSIIKALGAEFRNEYHSLPEQILDYMELVRVLDRDKLFILLNPRSYISDEELELLAKDILAKGYHVLFVDSFSRRLVAREKRITIDDDLCEI